MALAQGLVIGPALWGLIVNFVMFLLPGMTGAIAAWVAILGIGCWMAWRTPDSLRLSTRTMAVFAAAALSLFWVALAGRQLLSLADTQIHLGLAASIRAGGHPPVLPWHPQQPAPYHYGVDMLIGLLAPPIGPDLAFITELLGAYIWTSLALSVGASILKYGGRISILTLSPLLLSPGAWTLVGSPNPPNVLQMPILTGFSGVELQTTLYDVYWPSLALPLDTNFLASPPNIWNPSFPLAYALSFIVLERLSSRMTWGWQTTSVLIALIGFIGLVDESVALIGLALWSISELANLRSRFRAYRKFKRYREDLDSNRFPGDLRREMLHAIAGPALTALLLAASGGVVTGFLTGASHASLSFELMADPGTRRPLGSFVQLEGGMGLLGIGPIFIAVIAVLIAKKSRLVVLLTIGSLAFLIAALVLNYEPFPKDITRMDGHARNFALMALLIALARRLSYLRTGYRYAAALVLLVLFIWPTSVAPARALSLALERGPSLSNASAGPREFHAWFLGRFAMERFKSDIVAEYIRNQTPVDARVLSPHPNEMTIATGRPNASGFANLLHIIVGTGPEYKDAIRYLEPSAIRQLGFEYVHATDSWMAGLPDRAVQWLNEPTLFDLLVRDGTDSLYRIQPEFLEINVPPSRGSFEALRRAVPESASVYISPNLEPRAAIRAMATLSQVRQFGEVQTSVLHLLTKLPLEPLGSREPDLVVTSSHLAPSALSAGARRPIWWNESIAIYAPAGTVEPIMEPPQPHLSIEVSDVRIVDARIAFSATFTDRASDQWTGQDWLVISVEDSPWAFPDNSRIARRTQAPARSFKGQLQPVPETKIHEYIYLYEFDLSTATLATWNGNSYVRVDEVSRNFGPGRWMLAVRLLRGNQEVALVPLIRFELQSIENFTYKTYEGSLNAMLAP